MGPLLRAIAITLAVVALVYAGYFLAAAGIALFIVVHYAVWCAVRGYRDCWCCDGKGHHRSKRNRKLSRPCRWCKRSGKRLRIGRRVWNRARRAHREAAR